MDEIAPLFDLTRKCQFIANLAARVQRDLDAQRPVSYAAEVLLLEHLKYLEQAILSAREVLKEK